MITKNELLQLSGVHNAFCISIYIPTHRAGEETLKGQDALNLKNQLKGIKQKMGQRGMSQNEIEKFVNPVTELIKDSEFWRHQSDGLAVFLTDGLFKKFTVPIYFDEFNYLSSEFYVKPLMPLFSSNGLFYLLTLKMDEVKLYEATRYSIAEIVINHLVPSEIKELVDYDNKQKNLQFRTHPGNRGEGVFHGHGDSETETKNELLQYFRAIDKGILSILNENQEPPLVLCCLDFHYPIFQEVNTYRNLFPRYVSGNPADKDKFLLHEEARDLLEPYFKQHRNGKVNHFLQFLGKGKSTSNINEILPASLEGRIDTLFLENKADIFGIYDPATRKLDIDETHSFPNVSLINLIAVKVFEQGGTVYIMEKEGMPDVTSKVNALFRY